LLGLTEVRDQQQVARQRMTLGKRPQPLGAADEEIAPRQVEEGGDVGGSFDLSGFEYLA
jgi:hypothetical protein